MVPLQLVVLPLDLLSFRYTFIRDNRTALNMDHANSWFGSNHNHRLSIHPILQLHNISLQSIIFSLLAVELALQVVHFLLKPIKLARNDIILGVHLFILISEISNFLLVFLFHLFQFLLILFLEVCYTTFILTSTTYILNFQHLRNNSRYIHPGTLILYLCRLLFALNSCNSFFSFRLVNLKGLFDILILFYINWLWATQYGFLDAVLLCSLDILGQLHW